MIRRILSLICLLVAIKSSGISQFHPDNLTSTSIQSDKNGNQIQNYLYSAFGQSRYTQSTNLFKVSRRRSVGHNRKPYFAAEKRSPHH